MAFDRVSRDYRVSVGLEGVEHFFSATSCDNLPFTVAMPDDFRLYICEDPTWRKMTPSTSRISS